MQSTQTHSYSHTQAHTQAFTEAYISCYFSFLNIVRTLCSTLPLPYLACACYSYALLRCTALWPQGTCAFWNAVIKIYYYFSQISKPFAHQIHIKYFICSHYLFVFPCYFVCQFWFDFIWFVYLFWIFIFDAILPFFTKLIFEFFLFLEFAFHVDVATAYKIIADSFSEKEICELTEIQLFPPQKMVSIVQKGSPLRKMITYG